MQTLTVRISTEAQAIALQYGKSVSQGIMDMESRLQKVTLASPKVTEPVSPNVTSHPAQPAFHVYPHDEAYWARLRDEVRESVKPPKPKQQIVPASTLKTIGKIDPEEMLQEPIGKQGREIK
jgi:hypothetical protein